MSDRLATAPALILIAVVGSAVYVLAPGLAYVVIALVFASICATPSFQRSFLDYVDPYRLAGAMLFNIVYLAFSLRSSIDTRTHFLTVISLGTFLISYASARLALVGDEARTERGERALRAAACIALFIVVAGQVAEAFGYMDPRVFGARPENTSFFERPGGFMNANMTAAVALTLLYVVFETGRQRPELLSISTLLLACVSVLITQSRASMLFGGLYLFLLFWRGKVGARPLLLIAAIMLAGLIVFFDQILLGIYLERLTERFGPDGSAGERLRILKLGFDAIGDAPLLGHGYRYVQSIAFVSTHNEIVENLVNYGIIGSIGVWIAFFLIYRPRSWSFLIACIAPALLFSHNFFETVSLQAVLGVACALSPPYHSRLARLATTIGSRQRI